MTKGNDKTYDREREGVITALTGLTLNLVLGAIKLAFGIVTGSLSMLSDAVNNLSDVGTSAVVVSSFAISRKRRTAVTRTGTADSSMSQVLSSA